MLRLADKNLSVYKGDYKPAEVLKNGQKLASFKTVGMNGEEAVFEGTYNAPMTVYGKSGYLQGKNLCSPPMDQSGSYEDFDTVYSWEITAKENGYFDVSGAMITGSQVATTLLEPGTYTASGCELISLWWDERGEFLNIPATFTLENQAEVLSVMWYTSTESISLSDQYIQIEKGETATQYSPYVGNSDFPPLIENPFKLAVASGEIKVEGGNLLPPEFGSLTNWEPDINGSIAGSYFFEVELSPGDYKLSFDVVEQPANGYYGYLYLQESNDDWQTITTYYDPLQDTHVNTNYTFAAKEGYKYRFWYWSSKSTLGLFDGWHLQKLDIPDGRYHYFPSNSMSISLMGVEVGEDDDYNYSETVDGQRHYYVSNLISGDTLKTRVESYKITGQETFYQKETGSTDFNCYYCDLSHIISKNRTADSFLCNYFETLYGFDEEKLGATFGNDDTNLYFFVRKKRFSTVARFTSWLKSMYNKNRAVELHYILDLEKTERLNTDGAFKSLPVITRVFNRTSAASLPLGMEKCIKIQD